MAEVPSTSGDAENPERRRVLGIFSKSLLGLMAVGVVSGPAAVILDPVLREKSGSSNSDWYRLGRIEDFRLGSSPQSIVLFRDRKDAWLHENDIAFGAVLAQRIEQQSFRVFSAVCPHLGCSVKPRGAEGFLCPCHNSAFLPDGSRVLDEKGGGNPSPRDLDALDWRITDGTLEVHWKDYVVGVADKREKGS